MSEIQNWFVTILPALIGFFAVVVMGPFVIPALRRLKVGQTEREELKSHQKKTGTPTMGGIMILIAVTIATLIFSISQPRTIPVLFLTVGFGIIGFVDDYLKVVKRRSDGLYPRQKMALQIVVTTIFLASMIWISGMDMITQILIPFAGMELNIGLFGVPLLYFAVIGTVNGVNFTDGLDGLASTVTAVVAVFFMFASDYLGGQIDSICMAVFGALLGFLVFNHHPAQVFMGDTGSLALGGFVAGAAYMLKMPIYIVIVGLIYVIEVLSVMIQVTYFKKTGGKRVFRMAPIHHHFELGGWSETKVVLVFSTITVVLCIIGYIALRV